MRVFFIFKTFHVLYLCMEPNSWVMVFCLGTRNLINSQKFFRLATKRFHNVTRKTEFLSIFSQCNQKNWISVFLSIFSKMIIKREKKIFITSNTINYKCGRFYRTILRCIIPDNFRSPSVNARELILAVRKYEELKNLLSSIATVKNGMLSKFQ